MLRGVARVAVPRLPGTRSYYVVGAGEEGIWGATMARVFWTVWALIFPAAIFTWKIPHMAWTPNNQWIFGTTDKWYTDGTEMEGDEATANLRIQRERIMPIMDAYQAKIEGGGAAESH
jgi:hypothetical protein